MVAVRCGGTPTALPDSTVPRIPPGMNICSAVVRAWADRRMFQEIFQSYESLTMKKEDLYKHGQGQDRSNLVLIY